MKRSAWAVLGALFVLVPAGQVWAGADKEDANITDADFTGPESREITDWYVSETTDKPVCWTDRSYLADSSLIAGHVARENGTKLAHYHNRHEWYPNDGNEHPKVKEADRYWDHRFVRKTETGLNPKRVSSADKNHQTCYEWAWTTSAHCTGTYNNEVTNAGISAVFSNDMSARGDPANVANGDVLKYGDHATYVPTAAGGKPTKLQWKWISSGVYEYVPDAGHEFDTPMCQTTFQSDVDTTKKIAEQGWKWTADFRTSPTVYGP